MMSDVILYGFMTTIYQCMDIPGYGLNFDDITDLLRWLCPTRAAWEICEALCEMAGGAPANARKIFGFFGSDRVSISAVLTLQLAKYWIQTHTHMFHYEALH